MTKDPESLLNRVRDMAELNVAWLEMHPQEEHDRLFDVLVKYTLLILHGKEV